MGRVINRVVGEKLSPASYPNPSPGSPVTRSSSVYFGFSPFHLNRVERVTGYPLDISISNSDCSNSSAGKGKDRC